MLQVAINLQGLRQGGFSQSLKNWGFVLWDAETEEILVADDRYGYPNHSERGLDVQGCVPAADKGGTFKRLNCCEGQPC